MKSANHSTGRLRRFTKWAGLVAMFVLAVLWYEAVWSKNRLGGLVNVRIGSFDIESEIYTEGLRPTYEEYEASVWLAGFVLTRSDNYMGQSNVFVNVKKLGYVPFWCCFLALAIPTYVAWRRDLVLRRRLKFNTCPNCAFDLTCLAAEAVCTECGKAR